MNEKKPSWLYHLGDPRGGVIFLCAIAAAIAAHITVNPPRAYELILGYACMLGGIIAFVNMLSAQNSPSRDKFGYLTFLLWGFAVGLLIANPDASKAAWERLLSGDR